MVSKDWALDDVSGVFGQFDIGLKLADVAKQAKVLGAKDKENKISPIKDLATRAAKDIVENSSWLKEPL